MKKWLIMSLCAAAIGGAFGCGEKSEQEKAENALQEMRRDVEESAEEAGEAAQEAGDELEKSLDEY